MNEADICYIPAVEMVRSIREKQVSPLEITEAILSRIERLNPKVNAYCTITADDARAQARKAEEAVMAGESLGALHGIPVSIKDLILTKGVRTTFGSRIYEKFVPESDAIVVERLKSAGAIILGKTNTPEFGFTGITDNLIFGPTRNPWNRGRHAGGSSGGAAASVASGMGPVAIGTDGGGSIRIPSCFCGIFGLKPSFGLVPRGPGLPDFPDWQTIAHTGPITRTVADAALTMEVIAGQDDRDHFSLPGGSPHFLPLREDSLKDLRIAWSPDLGYAVVEPQVLKAATTAARVFETLGASVEVATPKIECPAEYMVTYAGTSFASKYADYLPQWRDQMHPRLVDFLENNLNHSALELARAMLEREKLWNALQPFFEEYDLLLTPTMPIAAFDVNQFAVTEIAGVEKKVEDVNWWTPFTYPFNLTGQPAATVPCGWDSDGLPLGLQIVGRRFCDATVLRAAAAFEKAVPWADKQPPLD